MSEQDTMRILVVMLMSPMAQWQWWTATQRPTARYAINCKRHFHNAHRAQASNELPIGDWTFDDSTRLDLTHLLLDEHSLVVRAKLPCIGGGEEGEQGHEGGEDDDSLANHCCRWCGGE